MGYIAIIEVCIGVIPCKIGVTTYIEVPPWKGSPQTAPSDLDYYGYRDLEYDILKMDGSPYPWMENHISEVERDICENEIIEHMKELRDER